MVLFYSLEVAEGFISIADIARGASFSCPVVNVLGNAEVFLVVLYCSSEVAKVFISIDEIAIGTSFSGPFDDVLGNAKVFLVVLYCSLEVANRVISIAEIARGTSFWSCCQRPWRCLGLCRGTLLLFGSRR